MLPLAFVLVFTSLNLRGVQTSGRVNSLLALGMGIVVVIFIADAIRYIAMVARPMGGQWLLPLDTKRELPKFFKTISLAHIPESNIELYGVGRSKKSRDGLTEKYHVTNVPTFIVFSDGKELGRIVEHPEEGIEFDLVHILQKK